MTHIHGPSNLLARAAAAASRAYAPYSHYRVGAAVLADDGSIFEGANVENSSYGLTICAERAAVAAAVAAGARRLKAVAVVADAAAAPYPCGACRQVLAEFAPAATPVYVAPAADLDRFEETTLGELLPRAFKLGAGGKQ